VGKTFGGLSLCTLDANWVELARCRYRPASPVCKFAIRRTSEFLLVAAQLAASVLACSSGGLTHTA